MWEFKTAALSDRSHHNATAVTCQQDKNLDANTLDQAGDTDRRRSNDNTAYYSYYFAKLLPVSKTFFFL